MRYFISDLHFGHQGTLRFERTQFKNVEEHDAFIIESINSVVDHGDELYILGDVGWGKHFRKVKELNGRKTLILGNHDGGSRSQYLELFADIYATPIYLNKKILLSHVPVPVPKGVFNVHGHLHGAYLDLPTHLNVSCHMIDYKPISEKQLTIMTQDFKGIEVEPFLKEWYAKNTICTNRERTDIVLKDDGHIDLERSIKLKYGE